MTGSTPWKAQDSVEPIQADTIGAIANFSGFNTLVGCGATYSISDLVVTIAAGAITHTSAYTAVAGNTVTLVADPTNPRWTYQYVNSSGMAAIVSGSAAAVPAVPDFGANVTGQLVYVQAGLTIAGSATYKLDKRVMAPSVLTTAGLVQKYKTGTQVLSTTTSYADVIAAGTPATMSVAVAANEVWAVDYWVPLIFGGTGGAKFQITGPATPTSVDISGEYVSGDGGALGSVGLVRKFTTVTAFSSDIAAFNSASAGASVTSYASNDSGSFVNIRLRLINGATAGVVTLQVAQNSSNSTTTLGVGSKLLATRMA